jgi:hypothetical protein
MCMCGSTTSAAIWVETTGWTVWIPIAVLHALV